MKIIKRLKCETEVKKEREVKKREGKEIRGE
jgi:hypothetical protein